MGQLFPPPGNKLILGRLASVTGSSLVSASSNLLLILRKCWYITCDLTCLKFRDAMSDGLVYVTNSRSGCGVERPVSK
jgi:hypothetical protein